MSANQGTAWPPWKPGDRITAERLNQMIAFKARAGVTRVVAAYDSLRPETADYICDGEDDQVEINKAIEDLPSIGGIKMGRVVLLEGTYHLTAPIDIKYPVILQGMGQGTRILGEADCILLNFYSHWNQAAMDMQLWRGRYGVHMDCPYYALLVNLYIFSPYEHGINISRGYGPMIFGCKIFNAGKVGIELSYLDHATVVGNHIEDCGEHGIRLIYGSSNCIVAQNRIFRCSQAADNTYNGIHLQEIYDLTRGVYYGPCDNMIVENIVRHMGAEKQHKYGICVNHSSCLRNIVAHNDLYQSGRTGSLLDNGTDTYYFGGNKT
jgi:parallel beta-helix repeat protein